MDLARPLRWLVLLQLGIASPVILAAAAWGGTAPDSSATAVQPTARDSAADLGASAATTAPAARDSLAAPGSSAAPSAPATRDSSIARDSSAAPGTAAPRSAESTQTASPSRLSFTDDEPDPVAVDTPLNEQLAAMLRRVRYADSLVVTRAVTDSIPMNRGSAGAPGAAGAAGDSLGEGAGVGDSTRYAATKPGNLASSAARPDHEWARRFARVLRSGLFYRDVKCRATDPSDQRSKQPPILVHAYRGDRLFNAEILLEARCVNVSDRTLGDGSIELEQAAEPLLDLLREALPWDGALQRMVLPPVKRKEIPKRDEKEKKVTATPPVVSRPRVTTPPPAATRPPIGAPSAGMASAPVGSPPVAAPSPAEEGVPTFGESQQVDQPAEPITQVPAELPDDARDANIEGTVTVQALVGTNGLVKDTRVVESIPMLDSAAVECVRQWKFKPALSHGKPVEAWVTVPVKFTKTQ